MAKLNGITVDVSVKQSFGYALEALKKGCKVARKGWNGKGMYLKIFKPQVLIAEDNHGMIYEKEYLVPEDKAFPILPAIYIKTADNNLVPWVTSQMDVLAEDWEVVPYK